MEGRTAIITGAADGIGRATALLFSREGARLALADIAREGLEKTRQEILDRGGEAIIRVTDVGIEEEVKDLIQLTLRAYSRIDVLCNIAGTPGTLSSLEDQDAEEWRKVFQVNVLGTFFGTKHVAGPMRTQGYGAIVNTSSVAGIRSGAGGNAYSASKAAIINLTQTTACDLGAYNVRVNAVCPGLIETGMTKRFFDDARAKGREDKLGSRCELRRYGKPEEVASVILFLASEEASYITGQAIPVDGGNTASLNMPGMKV